MYVLPERLKKRRKELRLSQEALAALIGTNQGQVSRYETGENNPTADILILLAHSLDTTTDWLLGLTDIPDAGWSGPPDLDDDERKVIQLWRSKQTDTQEKLLQIMKVI